MAETRVGIITNPEKTGTVDLLPRLVEGFAKRGMSTLLDAHGANLLGEGEWMGLDAMAEAADLLVVLGGDGTILHTVRHLKAALKPLAAINTGRLGFLTCAVEEGVDAFVEAIANEKYVVSQRSILEVTVGDGSNDTYFGLNEAAVSRRDIIAGMISLEARINDTFFSNYSGDGLIMATPTGSTAYSFSAGGAIVEPESEVLLLTPICPHALTNRSMVVSDSSKIEVTLLGEDEDAVLAVDGQFIQRVGPKTGIRVARANFNLSLIHMPGQTFYDILRKKLRWHGSNV